MNPDDLLKLVTQTMPFGKHQGVLLADLPGNYLHWFAREGFPQGEIGRLLALMREIDHNGLGELLRPLREPRQAQCHGRPVAGCPGRLRSPGRL